MNYRNTSIAVIITCHNRREKTLKSLSNLMEQRDIGNVDLKVYLVDDGSTDGTADVVHEQFKDIIVIKGDGSLFWNGGMRLAYAKAMQSNHDFYLWLNDDTFLYNNAVRILLDTSKSVAEKNIQNSIVIGTVVDPETGLENYGGRRQKGRFHPLNFQLVEKSESPQKCDTFNGNIVLIPSAVPKKIGNISKAFSKQHSGDIDYGLRAKYAGLESWVAPGVVGECSSNSIEGTIFDKSHNLKDRIKQMRSPKGVPPAKEWMIFTKRHGGFLWPYYWFRTIIRVIFPFTYLFFRKPQD